MVQPWWLYKSVKSFSLHWFIFNHALEHCNTLANLTISQMSVTLVQSIVTLFVIYQNTWMDDRPLSNLILSPCNSPLSLSLTSYLPWHRHGAEINIINIFSSNSKSTAYFKFVYYMVVRTYMKLIFGAHDRPNQDICRMTKPPKSDFSWFFLGRVTNVV